jgi:hypothetical protein
MSYYQFIIKYHNKFNSDKPVLTDNVEPNESLATEATPLVTVIEALLAQKKTTIGQLVAN